MGRQSHATERDLLPKGQEVDGDDGHQGLSLLAIEA
jgi:hypothetical protein